MNATWGLFPPLPEELRRTEKRERAQAHLARARASFAGFLASHPLLVAEADVAIEPPVQPVPLAP